MLQLNPELPTPTRNTDLEDIGDNTTINGTTVPFWNDYKPDNLPPVTRGVRYLVPLDILLECRYFRSDFLSLGPEIFNKDGVLVGYAGLR